MNLVKDLICEIKREKNSVKFWHSLGLIIQLSIGFFVEYGWEWISIIQFFLLFFTIAVAYDSKDDEPNHFAVQFIGTYILMLIGQICYWIYLLFKTPVIFIGGMIKSFNNKLNNK